MASLEAARDFVYANARVVEERLFASLFDGAPTDGVTRALEAYRNDDGGFGHGLEPDKRCPSSQPIDVAIALELVAAAGASADGFAQEACDFLASAADEHGAVPLAFRSILEYPHAEHYAADWPFEPSLWATAWLAGWLHAFGVAHPWLDRATAFCFDELEHADAEDAHELRDILRFLRNAPDPERADAARPRIAALVPNARWFLADASSDEYGVSPLEFDRELFDDAELAPHLDRLAADQQPDGGWPLRWEPPSDASRLEWRGNRTVFALATLREHGRI